MPRRPPGRVALKPAAAVATVMARGTLFTACDGRGIRTVKNIATASGVDHVNSAGGLMANFVACLTLMYQQPRSPAVTTQTVCAGLRSARTIAAGSASPVTWPANPMLTIR